MKSFNNFVRHTNKITIKRATSSHVDCHGKLVFSKNCRANTIRDRYFLFCRFGVQTQTKTKFDWRRFRYFSAKLVCVISNQGHILPWIASGSVFYYFCFKHIGGIFFARALQCAKCETAHGFPSTAYSAHAASSDDKRSFVKRLILHYIPLLLRAAQLLCFFTPLLITYPLTYLGPSWFEVWLHVLYVAVEYSGATFIKLGQWASTRRDLFSKQVCDKFAHLHFQVCPHAWSHTASVLKEAYGDLWQEMLHLSDGQKPIGSGCIAQVYKGYISEELAGSKTCENNTLPLDKGLGNKKVSTLKDTLSKAKTNVIPVAIKVKMVSFF
ncbi:AARF domain containing kinase 2 [Plakobranchus ocellatus]|uniref:AARF domain containing kinase 2 n=1 Tax=Plakobranchus ocellatus TaxID=259542 RepID=A0AAV4BFL3_9GAST|nr:AARF domain containing kinase 2 [Plakobranchus ocellatus]